MAVGKKILTKIRSIQNAQRITKAVQMVSASKMRETQSRMRLACPYIERVRAVVSHLAQTSAGHSIRLLEPHREVRRAGFVLITSDKGLYGGLNASVLKKFLAQVQEYREQGIEVEVVYLGSRGLAACQGIDLNVIASATSLGDTPKIEALLGPLTEISQRYEKHELDRIHMVYSRFISTIRQEPRMEVLLPIGENTVGDETGHSSFIWGYLYEPSPVAVLEYLVRHYLESVVYQASGDDIASEQAAHMVTMKTATDNADNAIKELRLVCNKSRRAAITTELSEIIAGAAAV